MAFSYQFIFFISALFVAQCNSELTLLNSSSSTFYLSSESATWREAFTDCRLKGMRLLTILNKAQDDSVQQFMKSERGLTRVWTAAEDEFGSGTFHWSTTGTPLFYNNWVEGSQPSVGGCVLTTLATNSCGDTLAGWIVDNCANRHLYICS